MDREKQLLQQLGKRVRQARIRKKLTQRKVSHDVQLTEGSYRQIEIGECQPRASTIRRICLRLELSADYLLGI